MAGTGAEEQAFSSDVDERLGPSQHREQTQLQDLLERIPHVPGLARVGQIPEMIQKSNRLAEHPLFRCCVRHRNPPPSNQRITTDSALCAFVTHFLHPIALAANHYRVYSTRTQ
jgi:hypothetical protein